MTLIELVIVVVVVAVLAAILMANVAEITARTNVSRARSDFRTVAHGMELHAIDRGAYPPAWPGGVLEDRYLPLTTPISYLSRSPVDPFGDEVDRSVWAWRKFRTYELVTDRHPWHGLLFAHPAGYGLRQRAVPGAMYYVASQGPDLVRNDAFGNPWLYWLPYDPTNGTISAGDLFFVGPGGESLGG